MVKKSEKPDLDLGSWIQAGRWEESIHSIPVQALKERVNAGLMLHNLI